MSQLKSNTRELGLPRSSHEPRLSYSFSTSCLSERFSQPFSREYLPRMPSESLPEGLRRLPEQPQNASRQARGTTSTTERVKAPTVLDKKSTFGLKMAPGRDPNIDPESIFCLQGSAEERFFTFICQFLAVAPLGSVPRSNFERSEP